MQEKMPNSPVETANIVAPLTTLHFIGIAVLAVLAVLLILHGMKLARRRRDGTHELEARGHLDRTGDIASVDPAPGDAILPRPTADIPAAASGGEAAPVVHVPAAAPPPPVQQEHGPAVEPAAEPVPVPVPVAVVSEPAPIAAPAPAPTDLTLLKGLGPKVAAQLTSLGIPSVAALAALSDGEADALAAQLGPFAPRMARDRWLEQARLLAAGDRTGFEAQFGKL